MGKVACVGGLPGPRRTGRPSAKPSPSVRRTPWRPPPSPHALAEGVCLRIFLVICIHISFATQTARQKNYMVDKSDPTSAPACLLKVEKLACFPHGCWPCPPPRATHVNGKTAQVRRPSSCLCSWTGVNKWGVGLTLERTRRSKVTVRGTVGSLSRCLKGHCSRHLGLWRGPRTISTASWAQKHSHRPGSQACTIGAMGTRDSGSQPRRRPLTAAPHTGGAGAAKSPAVRGSCGLRSREGCRSLLKKSRFCKATNLSCSSLCAWTHQRQ